MASAHDDIITIIDIHFISKPVATSSGFLATGGIFSQCTVLAMAVFVVVIRSPTNAS